MKADNENNKLRYIYPLIFVVTLLPLITHLKAVPLDDTLAKVWGFAEKVDYDFFSYYKSIALYIAAICSIIAMMMSKYRKSALNDKCILIALAIFIGAGFFSTLLSEYKNIAFFGFANRYEGFLVIVSYSILFVSAILLLKDENSIAFLMKALLLGASIIGLIGLGQIIGYDFFNTSIGRNLIISSEYINKISLDVQNSKDTVYSTLYHYNYVGSYMAMLVPISLILFIHNKVKISKIVLGLISLLMIINLLGSTSRAGLIGTATALLLFLIMTFKDLLSNWKYITMALVGIIVSVVAINFLSGGYVAKRFVSLQKDIYTVFNPERIASNDILELSVNEKEVAVTAYGTPLQVRISESSEIRFVDSQGKDIPFKVDDKGSTVTFSDPMYKDFVARFMQIEEKPTMNISKGNVSLYFSIEEDGFELIDNRGNILELDKVHNVEYWGFEGLERIGSARGYIWSRTIPLLKDTILLGNGPDTFALYFPQYDIIGKLIAYDTPWMTVDKPHNLYLQTAVNTGLISLAALLFVFISYSIKSWKLYRKSVSNNNLAIIGQAIFIGIVGYLVAGLFNDSVVSVAPVFWVLLGLGVSINNIVTKQLSKDARNI